MKKILNILYSTRLMAVLFLVFAVAMGVATFIENDYGTQTAQALVYSTWWFELIMVLFMINFFGNIFKYKLYKKEKWVVLLFHLAFVLIIVGAGITRYMGYEGIMPIKEGETSNVFMSRDNYLTTIIDDGKDQKRPIEKKMLLSSMGKPNYSFKADFKGQEVKFDLVEYIPFAEEKFVESEDGIEYLHFVESSHGGRHDHYIQKGTSQVVHGVLVGFESGGDSNTIEFKLDNDGALQLLTKQDGTFFRMADSFEGTVKKDSLQSLNLLTLHNVSGMQFVVPKPPVKGNYETISNKENQGNSDKLVFNITTNGETKQIAISGKQYAIDPPSIQQVGGLTFRMTYGAKQLELPFSIRLNDFQLENYPGSQSPMSYASEVTVYTPEKSFDYRIFMNNILHFDGYKFFQASYNITEEYEETHLSVNHDDWGTLITYVGYFVLFGGMVLALFMKNTRTDHLKNQLKKIRAKRTSLVIAFLLSFSTFTFAQQQHKQHKKITEAQIDSVIVATTVDKNHAYEFSKLVIQDYGGRMKPLHTFSSQLLRKVSGKDTYKGLDANQAFMSMNLMPMVWFEIPIVKIDKHEKKLKKLLKLPEDAKYASLQDFFDPAGNYILREVQEKAFRKQVKNKFETNVIDVDKRVNLLYSALYGDLLKIFPLKDSPENKWISHAEFDQFNNFTGIDSVFVRQIMPVYKSTLYTAAKTNDYKEANDILDGIKKFQTKFGSAVHPGEKKIDLEITYNNVQVFNKLIKAYLFAGLIMLLVVIFQIFYSKSKVLKYTVMSLTGLIVVFFVLHTVGLAAIWYISGHAPWSNAYESIIYVAWATMLFGLIYGRKSSMTVAAAAFLTAMMLMIASWNWIDPDIGNLAPVLNSWWLMVHVSVIVASYGPFGLSMILGVVAMILMLLMNDKNKKKIKSHIKELTYVNELSMTVGLVLLVIGNFLGGMWANESWGRYWGWDPKETWALISIMFYSFVLHLRLIPGLKGVFTFNFWSVITFGSILMTYFGVNFYLSGMHSYASGDQTITPTFVYYTAAIVAVFSAIVYWRYKKNYKTKK
ncbi:cytochrome c biogenesis protein CcsA [Aureivirga sp. CE67]|uniref:cytochrome c biogenesis protein CcsA n=1 Tax=Aureivirga sp. CE67 TaxID=1788983 RepID=UPI0018C9E6CC|nr:cytochrome c biogenesis protein CcsA [Aureivirga sp. CE67]